MTSELTREKAQWLHDACEEAAAAGIKLTMNPNELLMFTSYALAAMGSEPVAYTDERNLGYIDRGRETAYLWGKQNSEASDVALCSHAQPAQVAPVDLPNLEVSTLLKIISGEIRGNATVASNLARHLLKAMSVSKATKQTMRTEFPSLSDYECVVAADVWNACRAAMLQAGNSPVIPDGLIGAVIVCSIATEAVAVIAQSDVVMLTMK